MPFPVFKAGQRLKASQLRDMQSTYVIKAANESVASSTVLQDDDELKIALAASAQYHVRLKVMFDTNASATPDIKTDWTIPTGATLTSLKWVLGPAAASATRDDTNVRQGAHGHSTVVAYGSGETTADLWINIEEEFIIDTVGAGTLQFRWAQQTSNATATEIRSGSFIRAERLG